MNKISKTFRLNSFVNDLLNQVNKKLGINKTNMIEMAVIEKSQKMGKFLTNSDEAIKCIDEMIKSLEKAKNKLK